MLGHGWEITFHSFITIEPFMFIYLQLIRHHLAQKCAGYISTCSVSCACIYVSLPLQRIVTDHHCDVIMGAIASEITSVSIVYSTVCSGTDQRKHQSSASLAFVRGIHRSPVTSMHKRPVTRKMSPFDDVIMLCGMLIKASVYAAYIQETIPSGLIIDSR